MASGHVVIWRPPKVLSPHALRGLEKGEGRKDTREVKRGRPQRAGDQHKPNKQNKRNKRGRQAYGTVSSTGAALLTRRSATGVSVLPRLNFNTLQADPFPSRYTAFQKWSIVISLASSIVPAQCGTEYVLNLNGLFDPDLTGGTHQPYGFDQLAALYSRYAVTDCLVELEAVVPAGLNWAGSICILAQTDATFSGLTGLALSDVIEKQGATILNLAATGIPAKSSMMVNLPRLLGLNREEYMGQDRFSGSSTANPASPAYLRMALANYTNVTSNTCAVVLRLAFRSEWYDRIPLAASN